MSLKNWPIFLFSLFLSFFIFFLSTRVPAYRVRAHSHNGMSHGIVNIQKSPHVCRCHRCSGWADKFWKRCYFCANEAFHHMVTCIPAMLYFRMVLLGTYTHIRSFNDLLFIIIFHTCQRCSIIHNISRWDIRWHCRVGAKKRANERVEWTFHSNAHIENRFMSSLLIN